MERSGYFNDQKVFETDLNNTEATKASQSVYRTQAPLGTSGGIGKNVAAWSGSGVFRGGVYGSPADYLTASKNLYVTATSTSQLDIATGVALSPQGELIRILTAQTLLFGGVQWPSGSGASLNYVKVRYTEATGSVKVNNAGIPFPTRYFGSYAFRVDNVVPNLQELLLATFTADGGGLISAGTFADRRTYVATVTPSSAVILDPTAKPVAAHITVEDHVRAVGTGVPSTINPHGLSIADLTSAGTTLVDHLLDGHVSGIIPLARTSAAYNSYSGSLIPQPGATPDYIAFAPNVNAILSTGGQYYTASVAPLTAAQAPADGDYWIFAAPGPVAQFISMSVYPTIDALAPHVITNCLLGSVTIANLGLDMSNFVDRRQIWTLTQNDVRGDFIEGFQQPSASLPQTATLVDNLDRIRYQLGLALNGTAWNGAHPLTAGPSSIADVYHTHGIAIPIFTLSPIATTVTNDAVTLSATPPWSESAGAKIIKAFIPYIRPSSSYTYAGIRLTVSQGNARSYIFSNVVYSGPTWGGGVSYTVLASATASVPGGGVDFGIFNAFLLIVGTPVGYPSGSVYGILVETEAPGANSSSLASLNIELVSSTTQL